MLSSYMNNMILKIADASDQLHITLQSTHYKRSCFVIQKLSNQKLSINISCGYNLAATIKEPSIYSCHPGNTLYNTYCCINISIIDFILRALNKIKISSNCVSRITDSKRKTRSRFQTFNFLSDIRYAIIIKLFPFHWMMALTLFLNNQFLKTIMSHWRDDHKIN